jgi:hypothetical protein
MTEIYNTTVRQGDTFQETFTFSNDDGSPLLLIGYSAVMIWRDAAGVAKVTCSSTADPPTMTIACGSMITVLTPVVSAEQTAALAPGDYPYILQHTSPGGIVSTPLKGLITVLLDGIIPPP